MGKYSISKAECIRVTDKAILVEAEEFDEPIWIPQSQVHEDSEVWQKGQTGDLIVTDWFAEKQGWI
jgi:hypothetical protein